MPTSSKSSCRSPGSAREDQTGGDSLDDTPKRRIGPRHEHDHVTDDGRESSKTRALPPSTSPEPFVLLARGHTFRTSRSTRRNVSHPGTRFFPLSFWQTILPKRGRDRADPRVFRRNTRQREDVFLSSQGSSFSLVENARGRLFGTERRARGADDPESRLWTFTNASTLPVGVTTRVCTGGERVPLLLPPTLPGPRQPSPSSVYPLSSALSPLFVLLRAVGSFASCPRSCGPP